MGRLYGDKWYLKRPKACTPTCRDRSANVSQRDRPFNHLSGVGGLGDIAADLSV
jgi:hypothetical protein